MGKELLTAKNVKRDLGDLVVRYVWFFAFAAVFCTLIAVMGYLEYGFTSITQITLGLDAVVILYSVFYILKLRKSSKGEFIIVTDRLSEKSDGPIGRYDTQYVLKFSEYGRYEIPNSVYRWKKKVSAEKLYSCCTEGDGFYLVVGKDGKGEILAVYNKKHFELSGELSVTVKAQ
ncbi:MAG: hypothetical protein E7647_00875 [Ruminococcaceae bacterium]|nr:hypothetical protein [Oscillospiraceae bacterium]